MKIGTVCELVRYPVKSMAGVSTDSVELGWHGLVGDRRYAFRRMADRSGFPWLSASRMPTMLLHKVVGTDATGGEPLPTHVLTPDGKELVIGGEDLNTYLSDCLGEPVELMHLKHGIFDEAAVSVINLATISGIGNAAKIELDRRRFRANIIVDTCDDETFVEDRWVNGTLVFGNGTAAPAINVTQRDVRCVMINIDPKTGEKDSSVMKSVVQLNENCAGVYGTVLQTGTIRVGDPVNLVAHDS